MSYGSAASLPGPVPQAPLHPFPTARSARSVGLAPQSSGRAAPPRMMPLVKAADDPPRGRILLVDGDASKGLEVQRLLHGSGYRVVGPAASVSEAEHLLERAAAAGRPVACALLDIDLDGARSIADRLAARVIPVIWLSSGANPVLPASHMGAAVIRRPCGREALLDAIEDAIRQAAGRRLYTTPPPQPVWPRIFPPL
jgi:CheY-like chemotaxis protein